MQGRIDSYFRTLAHLTSETVSTDRAGQRLTIDAAIERSINSAREAHGRGNKLMFIGNGGSAAIASHMAIDYTKSGNLRSLAFNDSSSLTCLANDFGYENVFAKQIEMHARAGDLLIAISSSGRSPNILAGVAAARGARCDIITLSGFGSDNPLRRLGDINYYVPSDEYGFVEITHLSLCHAVLDLALGWGADDAQQTTSKSAAE